MRKPTLHKIAFGAVALGLLVLPALLLVLPAGVESSEQAMANLPAFNKFKCQICHVGAQPTAEDNALNNFGRDFQSNGMIWNAALAQKNSDGDRCSNGFELGDPDGDGIFDNGADVVEHSNPGDPTDCAVALTVGTWSVIKSIFGSEMQQYEFELQEDFSPYFP